MEPVELEVKHPLRDPMGNVQRYNATFRSFDIADYQKIKIEEFSASAEEHSRSVIGSYTSLLQQQAVYMYSRGDPIADLVFRLQDDLPFLQAETEAYRQRWGALPAEQTNPQEGFIWCSHRHSGFSYMALALLLLPQRAQLQTLATLLNTLPINRFYMLELLLKAFVPEWQLAKKYNRKEYKNLLPWSDPILRALSLPGAEQAPALAAYMKAWCRTMQPWGWKPVFDFSEEIAERRGQWESLFVHFAYEVALAVCAYDLDDSSFAEHPYYPRDLVAHYRTHLRHSRDAWRAVGVGAAVAIDVPPPVQKADLAKSKRKGAARWVELASDGEVDATDAVIDQVGKLRKVKDVEEWVGALAENDVGLHADVKDADTLEQQLSCLCAARGLGEWVAPDDPTIAPAGPARCEQLLHAASAWLQARGYCLLDLDADDDAWHAVAVKTQYHAEFLALSLQLALLVGAI